MRKLLQRLRAADGETWDRIGLAAVIVGVGIRLFWALIGHRPMDFMPDSSDMLHYVTRGQLLAQSVGGDLLTREVFEPIGLPLTLAPVFWTFGTDRTGLWAITVLWALVSAANLVLVWRVARLATGPAASAIAVLLLAAYPLSVTEVGYFHNGTLSVTYLLAFIWLSLRLATARTKRPWLAAAASGAAATMAMATRPQTAINVGFQLLRWVRTTRDRRPLAAAALALVVGTGSIIGFNSHLAGRPMTFSQTGGVTFFMGHCEPTTTSRTGPPGQPKFPLGSPSSFGQRSGKHYDLDVAAANDRYFLEAGLACIGENGLGHLRVLARHLMTMLMSSSPWPQSDGPEKKITDATNVIYSMVFFPVLFLGWRLARRREDPGLWLVLGHAASVLVVALLLFGDPRFRIPYDVFVFMLAGALIADRFGLLPAGRPAGRTQRKPRHVS